MERPYILLVAPVVCALANWLPNDLSAEDLAEAKVTQVVQDVKVVPSGQRRARRRSTRRFARATQCKPGPSPGAS